MAVLDVNATRMELKSLKTRLDVAKKGHKLLKNKCDGLVRKLSELKKSALNLREQVEGLLREVFLNFEYSKVQFSSERINFFVRCFENKDLVVKIEKKNFMGVKLPYLMIENLDSFNDFRFLFLQQSQFFDESFKKVFENFPRLVELAQIEKSIEIMQHEIKQTRRKVNALEFLIMPNYVDTIKSIELRLEENERNNIARLSKVKINNEF